MSHNWTLPRALWTDDKQTHFRLWGYEDKLDKGAGSSSADTFWVRARQPMPSAGQGGQEEPLGL